MTNTQSCKHKTAKMLTPKGHDLLTWDPIALWEMFALLHNQYFIFPWFIKIFLYENYLLSGRCGWTLSFTAWSQLWLSCTCVSIIPLGLTVHCFYSSGSTFLQMNLMKSLCYVPGSTDPRSDKNPCNLGIKIRRSRKAIQAIIKVWIQEEKPSQAQASCLITRLIQNSLLT